MKKRTKDVKEAFKKVKKKITSNKGNLICNMYIGSKDSLEARAVLAIASNMKITVGEFHKLLRQEYFEREGLSKSGVMSLKKIKELEALIKNKE